MNRSPEDLYKAATALEPLARKRFLDENCADPAARAEVDRLLASEMTKTILVATALAPGSTLGHYTIQHSLGAGGMGVVYEAIDQVLHRTVAIKILAPGAIDEDTRLRFLREAQAASALNHPSIVTVYEVGQESGTDFIVMERISGQTIRQTIGKRGIPARTAVAYAIQMADALATAHEAGIVHRDLKPGNVMVTERGLVKLLDFGLAKLSRPAGAQTAEISLTRAGHTVGTVFYMSPEQAQGKNVDARSDIFSFGAVLYEMLTGARAFHGDSEIATLAAVLEREPVPIGKIAPEVAPPLQRIISKCLAKKPHDRWQHMLDVKLLLEDLLKDLDSPPEQVQATRANRWLIPATCAVAGVILTVAAFRFFRPPAALAPEPVYRMLTATSGLNDDPALSKDGRFIAFSSDRRGADNGDNLDIWLQQIGAREPIRLTSDPADETDPAFSPDGTRIAFRSEKDGGGIYVVPTLGGDPMLLVPGGRNPRFSPDGRWLAYWTGRGEGSVAPGTAAVFIVESAGGQPRAIHPEMGAAFYPSWSPGSDRLLVRGWKGRETPKDTFDFWALPIDGGEVKKTGGFPILRAQGLTGLHWEGPLEWVANHALFAASLGDSTNLWETDLSQDGVFTSNARRVTKGPGRQANPAWAASAETERVAFSNQVANYDVWTIPVDAAHGKPTGGMARLTNTISTEWAPSISDDGRLLLYVTSASAESGLIIHQLDTGRVRTLVASQTQLVSARISGDGRRVAYVNNHYDLLTIPTAGGTVEKLCDHCGTITGISHDGNAILYEPVKDEDLTMFDARQRKSIKLALRPQPSDLLSGGRFSPDEKWVAFHSMEGPARTTRVWVAPVNRDHPAAQSDWIAITDAAEFAQDPCWSSNGDVLYFTSERDGFRCFWGQPLDPKTRKASGAAFALRHFHSARQSLRGLGSDGYLVGLSSAAGRTVFSFPELTGNIWLQETPRAK
jgi:serine/threonine protein kinase/Tol biopolymer transport system component